MSKGPVFVKSKKEITQNSQRKTVRFFEQIPKNIIQGSQNPNKHASTGKRFDTRPLHPEGEPREFAKQNRWKELGRFITQNLKLPPFCFC